MTPVRLELDTCEARASSILEPPDFTCADTVEFGYVLTLSNARIVPNEVGRRGSGYTYPEFCMVGVLEYGDSAQFVGGFNPSPLVPLNPKFVLTPEQIVKISQKYIADPPLVFPQFE